MSRTARLGLISDTHDLLRPEAIEKLQGCEAILHAGDICSVAVIRELQKIAPVVAVCGNDDHDEELRSLPDSRIYDWRGVRILLVHDRAEITTVPPDVDVVVFGHSHKPQILEDDGRLWVNPGSAGRRRFQFPVSIGCLVIGADGKVHAELRELVKVER